MFRERNEPEGPRGQIVGRTAAVRDTQDAVYAACRVGGLVAGVSYALLAQGHAAERQAALYAFGAFALYSALLYAAGWRLLRSPAKGTFYGVAFGLDLVFVAALVALTGGAESPFYRALYLWTAMAAFYHGLRIGTGASLLAVAVYGAFQLREGFPGETWTTAVTSAGLLVHGPLVGYVAAELRQRAEALRVAHLELRAATDQLAEDQAQLVQAEKLSSIGLLVAGVAHEVNNPLQGVIGCARSLASGQVAEERRSEYHQAMLDGLDRIRLAVEGLLDYSRRRDLNPTLLDARELLTSSVRMVTPGLREKNTAVRTRAPDTPVWVFADRAQLLQALVNLLMNAVYASPPGEAIDAEVEVSSGRALLRFIDRGAGIPAELLPRVTEPFFTTKPPGEGTGLGLAITNTVARSHGGELCIESLPGRPTSVTLWLPQAEGPTLA